MKSGGQEKKSPASLAEVLRSASLCSGELHPDIVVHKEQSLKAMNKAYYSNLEKYHNDCFITKLLCFFCQYDCEFANVERKMVQLQGS
ncbi:hypothetical protein ACS0TY_006296 [Phlomoides rotata]